MPKISPLNRGPNAARVAVVASGIVSPLGLGIGETLASLREGRDCVSPVTRFPVDHARCKSAGQVADAQLADADKLRPRSDDRNASPFRSI